MADSDYIEVYKDNDNQYRWRVKAGNGEVITQGESYTRRVDAIRGIPDEFSNTVIKNIPDDESPSA